MTGNVNTRYVRSIDTQIESDSIVDGNQDFDLNPAAGRNLVVEYFHFVNASGDIIDVTAGTVTLTVSSGADIFQTLLDNQFNAADARSSSRRKPSGYGLGEKLRVTLSSIAGNSVAGFKALITQNA